MRFAKSASGAMKRAFVPLALCAVVAGCASIGEMTDAAKPSQAPGEPSPAATSVAPGKSQAQAGGTVSADTQRQFDDAVKALRAGRVDEAERAYTALARSNPELGGPHANLGLIYRRAGKFDEAVAELEQAVRASPRQPLYLNELGIAYRQQGKFKQAREAYEQAIALDSAYAVAYLNLGILHDLYLQDGARALELYDRYLSLSPDGDPVVSKWVADLKNRNRKQGVASVKEKS